MKNLVSTSSFTKANNIAYILMYPIVAMLVIGLLASFTMPLVVSIIAVSVTCTTCMLVSDKPFFPKSQYKTVARERAAEKSPILESLKTHEQSVHAA